MEPGTGKTRVVIDFVGIKYMQGRIKTVFIVGPVASLYVWEDEIKKWLPKRIPREVHVLDGPTTDRQEFLKSIRRYEPEGVLFVITNYDVIYKLRDYVKNWQPDLVVADEMHMISHHSSQRSRAMHSIGALVKYRMGLTGTSVDENPLDIFSQYKFVNPRVFGTRWVPFKNKYALWGGFGGFRLLKYQNLDHLTRVIHSLAAVATKDDDLNLPERRDQVIRVKMGVKTARVYKDMEKEFVSYIEELGVKATASIILTQMMRLSQITGGFVNAEQEDGTRKEVPVGTEKLDVLEDLLLSHKRKKVVIFARFKWELRKIAELCDKLKISYILNIKGDEWMTYQSNPKVKIFISQISKGISMDLTSASIAIFYSLDYSAKHLIQAKDRVHRTGQSKPVLYQYLIMDNSIDREVYKRLQRKRSLASSIIDDWKKFVKGDK